MAAAKINKGYLMSSIITSQLQAIKVSPMPTDRGKQTCLVHISFQRKSHRITQQRFRHKLINQHERVHHSKKPSKKLQSPAHNN